MGLPDEPVETLNADHRQMVKCIGKDDDRYRAISGVLKQLHRYSARSFPSGRKEISQAAAYDTQDERVSTTKGKQET